MSVASSQNPLGMKPLMPLTMSFPWYVEKYTSR